MASERPAKKEKKDKKEKQRSETDGVHKSKKDKKDKKEKKEKLIAALDEQLQADVAESAAASDVLQVAGEKQKKLPVVAGAIVPFAVPLADEKNMKKVMKTIRKSARALTLKRGVKEVVKTLRKSPPAGPSNIAFPGVVVIAGDISPMDVISHIPVLCEDHNVPYIFVTSRAELGAAAKTKRPTSVVMVMEKQLGGNKKQKLDEVAEDGEDDGEDFSEAYAGLVKLVQKETTKQSFW